MNCKTSFIDVFDKYSAIIKNKNIFQKLKTYILTGVRYYKSFVCWKGQPI